MPSTDRPNDTFERLCNVVATFSVTSRDRWFLRASEFTKRFRWVLLKLELHVESSALRLILVRQPPRAGTLAEGSYLVRIARTIGVMLAMALPHLDHRLLRWLARLDALPSLPEQAEALEEIAVGGTLAAEDLAGCARAAHACYRRAGIAGEIINPRLLCLAHDVLVVPVDSERGFTRYRADLERWVVSVPQRSDSDRQRAMFELGHEFAETLVGHRSHPDVQTLVPLLALERSTVTSALVRSGGLGPAIARLRRRHAHWPAWVIALSTLWHGLDDR